MATGGKTHGLKYHARTICATAAETSEWLAGTTALTEENEIQILRLDGNKDQVQAAAVISHPAEIWSMSASPTNAAHFATAYQNAGKSGAALWSLPGGEERGARLETELKGHTGDVRAVRWHPSDETCLATVAEGELRVWNVAGASAKEAERSGAAIDGGQQWSGTWAPNEIKCFCTSRGGALQVWDVRDLRVASSRQEAHSATIRDVDFSHHSQHYLASCGDDCKAKVWDLRLFSRPLTVLSQHAHWVWQAKFNPKHDQLLLTSSSDGLINLHQLNGLGKQQASPESWPSSQRWQTTATLAATFDVHEDSVHGLAWSSADPWLFASVSYDGRVAVNRVPGNVKYAILI